MGTLKVDNIQTESGSAIITNGVIPTTILKNSGVGMILLNTTDVTSATATVTFDSSLITDAYGKYIVEYEGLKPVSDGVYIRSRYSADNGVSFLTGTFNYGYHYSRLASGSTGGNASTPSDYATN